MLAFSLQVISMLLRITFRPLTMCYMFLCTFCFITCQQYFIVEYTNEERPPPGIYAPSEAQKHKVGKLKFACVVIIFASCH